MNNRISCCSRTTDLLYDNPFSLKLYRQRSQSRQVNTHRWESALPLRSESMRPLRAVAIPSPLINVLTLHLMSIATLRQQTPIVALCHTWGFNYVTYDPSRADAIVAFSHTSTAFKPILFSRLWPVIRDLYCVLGFEVALRLEPMVLFGYLSFWCILCRSSNFFPFCFLV